MEVQDLNGVSVASEPIRYDGEEVGQDLRLFVRAWTLLRKLFILYFARVVMAPAVFAKTELITRLFDAFTIIHHIKKRYWYCSQMRRAKIKASTRHVCRSILTSIKLLTLWLERAVILEKIMHI